MGVAGCRIHTGLSPVRNSGCVGVNENSQGENMKVSKYGVGEYLRVVQRCGSCSTLMEVLPNGDGKVIETVESDGHKNHLALDLNESFPLDQLNGRRVGVTDFKADYQIQL